MKRDKKTAYSKDKKAKSHKIARKQVKLSKAKKFNRA